MGQLFTLQPFSAIAQSNAPVGTKIQSQAIFIKQTVINKKTKKPNFHITSKRGIVAPMFIIGNTSNKTHKRILPAKVRSMPKFRRNSVRGAVGPSC